MKSPSPFFARRAEETKTIWDKFKSFLSSSERRRKSESPRPESEPQQPARIENDENKPEHDSGNNNGNDNDNDNDFSSEALSEVAAPEPAQRFSPEEYARRPSLEKRLSERSKSARGNDYDMYENLSELAAQEPVEQLSERDMARRPSLEQNLARLHSH